MAVGRNDHCEHLRRRDDATDRVHGQLLHHAIDRCRQHLQLRSSFRFDHVLGKARRLLFGFGQLVEERATVLRFDLSPCFDQHGNRGIGLVQLALLHQEVLLMADKVLILGEIAELRAEPLVVKIFANINTLLQCGSCRLELADGRLNGVSLGLLLRELAVDLRKLGMLFRASG